MEIIEISKDNLEYIKKLSGDFITEFPYPIYIEYGENSLIVVIITPNKYIEYFTHTEVIFPKDIVMRNLKMLINFNRSDIRRENVVNTKVSSNIDIGNIIKTIFKNGN